MSTNSLKMIRSVPFQYCILLSTVALSALAANEGTSGIGALPGAKTAAGVMASSLDGMSRYLARDGPIQPAIPAITGLATRGAEQLNKGISRISDALASGAQSMSRSAGNDGTIRMPGLDAMESHMPASFAQFGSMISQGISKKNQFIMGQAQAGIEAGERMKNMMQGTLKSVKDQGMERMGSMMSSGQGNMMKGTMEMKHQLKQSLQDHLSRLSDVHSMGGNMMNSVQNVKRTLSDGLSQTVNQIQRTGQQVKDQLKDGLKQNTQVLGKVMNSMQGSMGNVGQNMHKNIHNLVGDMTSAVKKVTTMPLEMIQGLAQKMKGSSGGANY